MEDNEKVLWTYIAEKKRPCNQTELLELFKKSQQKLAKSALDHLCSTQKLEKMEISPTITLYYFCIRSDRQYRHSETRLKACKEQIKVLKQPAQSSLAHMKLLHEYNDSKDVAQSLLGQLALIEGCCVRDLYPQFGLTLDD